MNKKTMKYIFPAIWNASYTMIMLDVLNWKSQITADGQAQPVSIALVNQSKLLVECG